MMKSKHFSLQPLVDDVFAAIAEDGGAAISNSGLIDLGGQILVFDTFLTPQAAQDLRQLSIDLFRKPPRIVINSHYHNDHIWGNQAFIPEAQIISSTRTHHMIATAGAEEFQWYSANSAQQLDSLRAQYQAAEDEEQQKQISLWIGYYEGLVEALPHLTVCLPDINFDHRLVIHGSKHAAELITFERAHSKSDAVLYLPDEGIVFMSDLLFNGCHPYLADGDPLQLDATRFVPGHGPVGNVEDLRFLIRYIEGCMKTAQRLLDKGKASEEGFKALKVPERYHSWQFPQFYLSNIRFLCKYLSSPKGSQPAH